MTKYTKHVHLNSDDLRKLCIDRNWYTCGDTIDYNHLFLMLRKGNDQQNGITDEDSTPRRALASAYIIEETRAHGGWLERRKGKMSCNIRLGMNLRTMMMA